MMRQMRENTKLIMWISAAAFVGLMVFGWGMDVTGRSASGGGELGRVNGEPITAQEWQAAYNNAYNQQQRQLDGPMSTAMTRQLENAVWDQLVMQKLVDQELRKYSIQVTNQEVQQAAMYLPPEEFQANPAFQTNGQFDLQKYHQFLASPQADDQLLSQMESYYRELIPRSKLFYRVTTGVFVPDSELWRLWRDTRETARVKYVFIDPSSVIADNQVSVTDAEVTKYYNDHKKEFEASARAELKYVVIERAPNAADTAASLAKAREVREELAAGADFAEVARRESADQGSAISGGDLGTIHRGQTVPAFDAAAFSQPLNQISEPVQTQFGYHIIQVQSRAADSVKARHILIPIQVSEDRENALLMKADSLEELGSSTSLEEAARQMGLRVRTGMIEETQSFLPGVGEAADAAVWAIQDAKAGDVSDVFETPSSFYMAEVVSKTEAGVRPLAQVKPAVTARLTQNKKLEDAKRIGRAVVDAVRSGKTLEQAAAENRLSVEEAGPFTRLDFVPGLGRANAVIGTAFGLNPGQTSGVVEAEGALFVVQTLEKTDADRQQWETEKVAQQPRIAQALAQQRWNQYLSALRENAKIVDNRAKVLRRSNEDLPTQVPMGAPF